MKIGSYPSISPATARQPVASKSSATPSFQDAMAGTPPVGAPDASPRPAQKPDFANMTRRQLVHWANEQTRTGKMSGRDSIPFVTLSMGSQDETFSTERLNFIDLAKQALAAAKQRGDEDGQKAFAFALSMMDGRQGAATTAS